MEYRDRILGLMMILIGLIAFSVAPEYRELRHQFHSNFIGPEMMYRGALFISMFAIIGPCLLLPYRYGAVPFILAVSWCAYHLHAELIVHPAAANTQIEQVQLVNAPSRQIIPGR